MAIMCMSSGKLKCTVSIIEHLSVSDYLQPRKAPCTAASADYDVISDVIVAHGNTANTRRQQQSKTQDDSQQQLKHS